MDAKQLYIVGYLSEVLNMILGIYETYEDAQEALIKESKIYTENRNGFPGLYITCAYLYPDSKSLAQ